MRSRETINRERVSIELMLTIKSSTPKLVVLWVNVIINSSGAKQLVFQMQTYPFPQELVIVEVSFPKHTELQKVQSSLAEDCPFFCRTQVVSDDCLILALEDISDLLEIDLVNSYGATGVRILNSQLQPENSSLDIRNFTRIENHNDIEGKQKNNFNIKKEVTSEDETAAEIPTTCRLERLTSLEDLVLQEEKIQAYFDVFGQSHITSRLQVNQEKAAKSTETVESDAQKSPAMGSEEIQWGPVVGGVALAALFVGGYKAIATLLNS